MGWRECRRRLCFDGMLSRASGDGSVIGFGGEWKAGWIRM